MAVVRQMPLLAPRKSTVKRVAAYSRVSSGKDAMLHSLSAQVSYYSAYIQGHPDWEFAGVYSDEAISGTKDTRDGFQRLIAEARAGAVDIILTKSISRFARNTVTLLETVRELKGLGVDVYFEEQNIHTISGEGELLLSILASYAQEESRSASENQLWRVRRKFEAGSPWNGTVLGYRYGDGQYVVQPEEAEIVRSIFADYLAGMGMRSIARKLNEQGARTRYGNPWEQTAVRDVLRNYSYTGNLLLQTTFREDPLAKRRQHNHGERPMYHVEDAHQPIVCLEEFEAAREERERRAAKHYKPRSQPSYPFTSMVLCGHCGKAYCRRVTGGGVVWICPTFKNKGKQACPSKRIPEAALRAAVAEALGLDEFSEKALHDEITAIRAEDGNILIFTLKDGSTLQRVWQDHSRADSWTPEMRAAARARECGKRRP